MVIRRVQIGIQAFMASQSAGGIVLAIAAAAAMIISNSPLHDGYQSFIAMRGEVRIGEFLVLAKPLIVWINDLWMAVFFFLVGLEIKRELLEGELSTRSQFLLPAVAALGGMIAPALIYAALNREDPVALRGWAIPAATDIAFALGVLTVLGRRVPASLKVFLTAVAIIDDLGAIVVIAAFYTTGLHLGMLSGAVLGCCILLLLNRCRVTSLMPYILMGALIWLLVLKSGVHATVAGVLTAMAIPLRDHHGASPLRSAEHALHPWVAFVVLPVFAFVNAGVSLQGVRWETLMQTVPLGIILGLLAGKALGVFGASWLMVKCAGAVWPSGATVPQFFGVCVLCGIGFTMSLFIGALAFTGQPPELEIQLKLGVLLGSLLSGLAGMLILSQHTRPVTD